MCHACRCLTGQVQARDPDAGLHAKIYYYLVSGNSHQSFYLDKLRGKLYTNAVLDREQRASYTLIVKASNDPNFALDPEREAVFDQDDPTLATVFVYVGDENDTPPTFVQDMYYAGESISVELIFLLICTFHVINSQIIFQFLHHGVNDNIP